MAALAGLDWIDIPRRHTIKRWIFIEHCCSWILLVFAFSHFPPFLRDRHVFLNIIVGARQRREEKKRQGLWKERANICIFISFFETLQCSYFNLTRWSRQVGDKRAEETGVEGFAGRPLWSRLPTLLAARRRNGCFLEDRLEGDAGLGLADLLWTVDSEGAPESLFTFKRKGG